MCLIIIIIIIWNILSEETAKTVACSMVHGWLEYCNSLLHLIYHPLPNFRAFRTYLHALSLATIDMNTSHWFLQGCTGCQSNIMSTSNWQSSLSMLSPHNSQVTWPNCWVSAYLVEISGQEITNGYTYLETNWCSPTYLQPRSTDHLEWTSYFSYFLW